MQQVYNESSPKKATNLTINSDLLSKSRHLKINLSATLEQALISEVRDAIRKAWLKENKKAILNLNNQIERDGLFSDSFREF
jgi:antitoxin CcdA